MRADARDFRGTGHCYLGVRKCVASECQRRQRANTVRKSAPFFSRSGCQCQHQAISSAQRSTFNTDTEVASAGPWHFVSMRCSFSVLLRRVVHTELVTEAYWCGSISSRHVFRHILYESITQSIAQIRVHHLFSSNGTEGGSNT